MVCIKCILCAAEHRGFKYSMKVGLDVWLIESESNF
jgi:hypothetical protein